MEYLTWCRSPGSLMDRILRGEDRFLPGCAFPTAELSWRLCVFIWWSSYVTQWYDIFQYSSTCCQTHVGACGDVLWCQALSVTVSRDLGVGKTYSVLKAPGEVAGSPGSSWTRGGGGAGWQVREILLAHDYRNGGTCLRGLLSDLILFRFVVSPIQSGMVVTYLIQNV
jgi:hypothetical protein